MENMYVVSRQTTTNGIATEVIKVTGRDSDEAILNAKIKAYKLMENLKNEASMMEAFVGVSDLKSNVFITSELWQKEIVTE